MAHKKLRGLGVAMVTPFKQDGSIDQEATKRLVEHLITKGTDFLVVQGTTGETPTLSPQERQEHLRLVVETNGGRLPIVLGKSSNNTAALVHELETMDYSGVDYILSAVPSYNKPTPKGMYQHFKAVAKASQRPIILYNVPGRTGANMPAETTSRLAYKYDNIVGIKEASGNLEQIGHILANRPKDFLVFSGDDAIALSCISMGADGVISVIGNAATQQFSDMAHAALSNDCQKAAQIHQQLFLLYGLLFKEGNPAGIKCVLNALGICENRLRLPLVPVSEELEHKIRGMVEYLIK
ncbi:MAG: 4-hydroxy-tetrahydrodipicolinate synthase [Bacteroidia bacterium]|nr:MAG: 4-hydroxy-tetrahydrodipicolinate synthase [Bacteroidia bacterium]